MTVATRTPAAVAETVERMTVEDITARLADGREPAVDPALVAKRDELARALGRAQDEVKRANEAQVELRAFVPGAVKADELAARTKAAMRRREEGEEMVRLYTAQLEAAEAPIAEARSERARALSVPSTEPQT
jgi:hypothetical protein